MSVSPLVDKQFAADLAELAEALRCAAVAAVDAQGRKLGEPPAVPLAIVLGYLCLCGRMIDELARGGRVPDEIYRKPLDHVVEWVGPWLEDVLADRPST